MSSPQRGSAQKAVTVKVLMLEDNPGDARLLEELLSEGANEFEVERVERLADALARLDEGGIDLVLSDLSLPDSKGIDTFVKIHTRHPSIPVIVMSGMEDQSLAMQTVEKGSQDYLVKGHVDHFLLVRAMRYALARAEAERLLAKERDLLHTMLDNVPDRIYFKDKESRFVRVSSSMLRTHHFKSPEEVIGKTDFDLFTPEHAKPAFEDEQQVMRTGEPIVDKVEEETWADGSVTWALTTKMPLRDKQGQIIGTFGLSRDITELKTIEASLKAERNLLHSLINNLPDRIYVKDTQTRYVVDNAAHVAFMGASKPEEVIGKKAEDLLPKEVGERLSRRDSEVMASGKAVINQEEVLAGKDGTMRWHLATKVPLRDQDGRVTGLVCISRDITEMKKMETALAEERNLLRTLIDTLPESIDVKDANGHYILDNAAHLRLVGKSDPRDVLGRTVHDLYSTETAMKFHRDDLSVIETGQPIIDKEEAFVDGSGQERWLQTTKMPIFDGTGKVTSFLCASRDITERKKSQEKLAHYTAELRKKNEEMEEDLHMAREIQDAFIPQHYPSFPGDAPADQSALRFYHKYQPTTEVGGDFFHVVRLSDTMAGVFICDVMGHGVRAALITAIQRALVEELVDVAGEPRQFIGQMNQALVSILKRARNSMFASAFYMVVDVSSGALRYVNAGHPKPLHVRRDAGTVEVLSADEKPGPVLGIFEKTEYSEHHVEVMPNDLIMLYTDGLLEVEGAGGDFYDSERLIAAVRRNISLPADRLLDEILADVQRFCPGKSFVDDICVIGMDVQRLCVPA